MKTLNPYEEARKRVKEKKGFYIHLGYYLSVIGVLILINMLNFRGKIWFIYPAIGWGISIIIHYLVVFGAPWMTLLDRDWEEQAIQREMEKMKPFSSTTSSLHPTPEEELEELPLRDIHKVKEKRWDDLV